VIKEDATYDLGILRVETRSKLKALPLGPAGDLMVGETVIAIGHPFGYRNTVSTGIVSAVGREIRLPSGDLLSNLIQTNASINPGNSGGPLLNINGELIGINVALREGAQGIAFALNADTVQQLLSKHLSSSRIAGIQHGLDCTEKVQTDGDIHSHVMVYDVATQTPAASAGLKKGDEIIQVADHTVGNRFDVERSFYDVKPGDKVSLTVLRGGKQINVTLALEAESMKTTSAKPSR
jgi:serine protease Do